MRSVADHTFGVDHEFGFELRVCALAEREWPFESADDREVVVARQLGTRHRRWDTIVVEVDEEGLGRRATFGTDALDSDLLHVVRNAPESWEYYRDALPDPGYPWRYVREAIHRASDRDALRERKRNNRIEIQRIAPYPDWVDRIVVVENKPDLDASAARDLRPQLERDVAYGLADEVWIATERTGESVEPALLEDVPVEAGIVAVGGDSIDVLWHPQTLSVDEPGTVIETRAERSEWAETAAEFRYVDPDEKRSRRLAIAERAYERGWRSYVETMRPDCRHFDLERVERAFVPFCRAKGVEQTAASCRQRCPDFEPEPPAWRTRGWPISGGPGKTVKRVLDDRRRRRR